MLIDLEGEKSGDAAYYGSQVRIVLRNCGRTQASEWLLPPLRDRLEDLPELTHRFPELFPVQEQVLRTGVCQGGIQFPKRFLRLAEKAVQPTLAQGRVFQEDDGF